MAPRASPIRRQYTPIALLWLLVLALPTGAGFAQESPDRLDSILPLLNPAIKDTNQLDMLIMVAESWYTSDNALPYLARMDSLSAELLRDPDPDIRRRARHARGAFNFFTGYHAKFARNIPLSLYSLRAALADFQVHNERHAIAETYDALGVLFRAVGRPERSLVFFHEELHLGRALEHAHVTHQALLHLATAHTDLKQLETAETYLDSCGRSSSADSSAALVERARIRMAQDRYPEAIRLLDQALIKARRSTNQWDQLPVLAPMARAYYKMSDHDKGLMAARTCARVAAEMGDQTARCGCTVLMGIGELAMGKLSAAETDLLEGLRIARVNHDVGVARELGDEGSMLRVTELLKDLYRRQGRTKEALEMTELWAAYKDSVVRMNGQDDMLMYEFQQQQYRDSLDNAEYVLSQHLLHERSMASEKARRNVFALIGLLLLAIAIAIWGRVRLLRRSNTAILAAQGQLLVSEKALESEAVRTRIARDIHDELGADLTKIAMLGSEVKHRIADGPEAVTALVDRLSGLSREAGGALKDIVWSVDPEQDTWEGLVHHARMYCQRVLHATGIHTELRFAHSGPDAPIDPATKRNIFLILKEALNNALKYGHAENITVHFESASDGYKLVVKDDGRGFDMERAGRAGNGLRNMRARATRLGAKLEIHTAPDSGTIVEMTCHRAPLAASPAST